MLLWIFQIFTSFAISTSASAPLNIIVDPGHGGKDRGAVYFGIQEAEINLKVAKELGKLLKSDNRFQFFLTREKDRFVDLEKRVEIAKEKSGDVFLSIHANAFDLPKARGAEFYFQNQLPPDEEAMFLAHKENGSKQEIITHGWPLKPIANANLYKQEVISILQDLQLGHRIFKSGILSESMRERWRGNKKKKEKSLKQAPFFVINNVSMPSTLIEVGYLSNKKEAQKLKTRHYQKRLALGIYDGLIKYKEIVDNNPRETLQ